MPGLSSGKMDEPFMYRQSMSIQEECSMPARNMARNCGKEYSESDLEYLCKFYEHDGAYMVALALGRTVASVMRKWADLKEKGLVEKYKSRDVFWV